MSVERDELLRLVEDLPEDQVPTVLAEVREHVLDPSDRSWPPAWFAAVTGSGRDTAGRVDELLAEGFGR